METQKKYETEVFVLISIAILALVGLFSMKQEVFSYESGSYVGALSENNCFIYFYSCNQAESIIAFGSRILLALVLWTVSPVGLIFFSASGALISRRTSKLKRIAFWIIQSFAVLVWASFMSLLLIAYVDSETINAFKLGGDLLNIAIISGMTFFLVMFVFVLYEKRIENGICYKTRNDHMEKDNLDPGLKNNKEMPDEKCKENIKFAGMEFTGLKDKIRRKIKDGIKEIVDDEIERRL